MFLQSFSPSRLKALAPALVGLAEEYVARWLQAPGGRVQLCQEVKAFTFEVGAVNRVHGERCCRFYARLPHLHAV